MSTKSFTRDIILSPEGAERLKNIMESEEDEDTCTWQQDENGL